MARPRALMPHRTDLTALVVWAHLPLATIGPLLSGLPVLSSPTVGWADLRSLVLPALAVAALGALAPRTRAEPVVGRASWLAVPMETTPEGPARNAAGVLLAAGAGRRMGTPKALVHDADGTSWLRRSIAVLRRGGCAPVVVVLGAESGPATALLTDQDVTVVVAQDWVEGMGASLRAGLARLMTMDSTVAVISLVDLPDVGPDVVERVTGAAGNGAAVLARAAYGGVPGHPVVIGRDHWPAVISCAVGDRGARDFLAGRTVELVECGDLAHGFDVDTREPRPDGKRSCMI